MRKDPKRYIVTKQSDDGTFEIGDHIFFEDDGSISCIEAQGWIDAEDVKGASKGMEYKVDEEWMNKRTNALNNIVENLTDIDDDVFFKLMGEAEKDPRFNSILEIIKNRQEFNN